MKKKNQKDLEQVNQDFQTGIRSLRYYHHGIKPWVPGAEKLPTQQQLATLSATLARNPADDPKQLCSAALQLWAAAHEALDLQTKCNADWKERQKPNPPIDIPHELPMPFDKGLAWLMPDDRPEDRARYFRTWLPDDKARALWQAEGFTFNRCVMVANLFPQWLKKHRVEILTERGKTAAKYRKCKNCKRSTLRTELKSNNGVCSECHKKPEARKSLTRRQRAKK